MSESSAPGRPRPKTRAPSVPVLLLVVRKPGTETGPAVVHDDGASLGVDDAIAAVRIFAEQLK